MHVDHHVIILQSKEDQQRGIMDNQESFVSGGTHHENIRERENYLSILLKVGQLRR